MLHIVIPGEPEAWARAGVFGKGRKPRFYDSQKGYKWHLKQFMMHALSNYADGDSKKGQTHFLSGGYDAVMRFYFPPPKTLSKRERNLLSWGLLLYTKKPDWDNLGKIVSDSGNITLYNDDAQLVSVYVKKYFCNDENPRTEMWIMPKKKITAEKVLSEVNLDEVVDFCEAARALGVMLDKYRYTIKTEYDPDELYASSIAYHLTKIVDEHGDMMKKLDKHKKLWHDINAEVQIPGEGKTLC
jgi:Holliday junction resolvase RusA-like endonuclease